MIRLRIDPETGSDKPPVFLFGITDGNVHKLTAGMPLTLELAELEGPPATVVVFHGPTPDDLRAQLAEILPEDQMEELADVLDAWVENEGGDREQLENSIVARCAKGGHQLIGSACACGENHLGAEQ